MGAQAMYPKYHFLGLRAGQSGRWIWVGGNWKVLNRVCEMGLEHGGWVGVRGDRGTRSSDVITKEPICQAKGEWKPLTSSGH